ncbi:hypothetical protein SprV_0100321400 [Sparganum proliferum]
MSPSVFPGGVLVGGGSGGAWQANLHLGDDETMVGPPVSTRDRLYPQYVPLVSPPDADIVQQESAIVVGVVETMGTQHASPGSMVCVDAGAGVTKANQLNDLRRRRQEGVQKLVNLFLAASRLVIVGGAWTLPMVANMPPRRGRRMLIRRSFMPCGRQGSRPKMSSRVEKATLSLRATAPEEGVARTHLLQLALFGEADLAECGTVHLVARNFSGQ